MGERKIRAVAISNEKGGVGKTALALNLGAALAKKGEKVLIVDMDPQFNATLGLGVQLGDNVNSVYDTIRPDDPMDAEAVIVKTGWENLHLLPSDPDLAGAEVELVDEEGRENRLKRALQPIENGYDWVLLDTPPSLSLLTINVFAYAREVLVPCQTHPYAFNALAELFDTIDDVNEEINPDLTVCGIVATFFDQRTRISSTILEQLKSDERYHDLLLETVVRVNTTIAESAAVGKPIVYYRTGSSGAQDYTALANELMAQKP